MDLNEIVTESEQIYSGRIVHLRVDTVRLANGGESKREIVVHHGAVCIVPITAEGSVLMVRQYRLAAGKMLLEIPAGTLEEGEEPIFCAARELEEETGYVAAVLRPLFSAYLAPGYSTELIHAYMATGLTRRENPAAMDSDENIVLEKIAMPDLESMIMRGELQDSKSIAAILTAFAVLKGE